MLMHYFLAVGLAVCFGNLQFHTGEYLDAPKPCPLLAFPLSRDTQWLLTVACRCAQTFKSLGHTIVCTERYIWVFIKELALLRKLSV